MEVRWRLTAEIVCGHTIINSSTRRIKMVTGFFRHLFGFVFAFPEPGEVADRRIGSAGAAQVHQAPCRNQSGRTDGSQSVLGSIWGKCDVRYELMSDLWFSLCLTGSDNKLVVLHETSRIFFTSAVFTVLPSFILYLTEQVMVTPLCLSDRVMVSWILVEKVRSAFSSILLGGSFWRVHASSGGDWGHGATAEQVIVADSFSLRGPEILILGLRGLSVFQTDNLHHRILLLFSCWIWQFSMFFYGPSQHIQAQKG